MKTFTSKLGTSAYMGIIVLFAMILLFLSMGLVPYFKHSSHVSYYEFLKFQKNDRVIPYVVLTPALLAILLYSSYRKRLRCLQVTDGTLVVDRCSKKVVIPLSTIESITAIPANDMMHFTYEGGFFRKSMIGFIGKYYHKNFGEMQWYCTKSINYVMVVLKDKQKIVFTPDEPEDFVNEVRRCMK